MANQIVQVEMHTICSGQLAVNVLHFRGDVTQTNLFLVAKDVVDFIVTDVATNKFNATNYMIAMSEECFLSAIVARCVAINEGPKYPKLLATTDFPGAMSGGMYSTTIAANMKLVTASGPDLTGRVFYPGVPESEVFRNRFQSTYQTEFGKMRDGYMGGVESDGDDMLPVVVAFATNSAENVTNAVLCPNPATQRRRALPY